MIKAIGNFVFCIAVVVLFACTQNASVIDGSGTETTTGSKITGNIVTENGIPASNVFVYLYPQKYNPLTDKNIANSKITRTDKNGKFILYPVRSDSGFYNVYVVDSVNRTKALVSVSIENKDVFIPVTVLAKTGAIKVAARGNMNVDNGYVYIPGTDIVGFFTQENSDAFVLLNNVPQGTLPSVNYAVVGDRSTFVVQSAVSVTGEDTVLLVNKYSRKILINTTASGIALKNPQTNVPVLVRLTNENFDFSSAKNDGSDIRFTKKDNTPLSYQIEQWDAVNQVADIWVKMDTVRGNDSLNMVFMVWGPLAKGIGTLSNGNAVFDTSAGFQGVWHLNEPSNSSNGGYLDATSNGNNGTGSTKMQGSNVQGIIGIAQQFTGDSTTFIDAKCPEFIKGNRSFSVSFWMNYQSATDRQWVVYFGEDSVLQAFHFLITYNDSAQFGFWDADVPLTEQNKFDISFVKNVWCMVSSMYDAEKHTLTTYINDSLLTTTSINANVTMAPSGGLHIGKKTSVAKKTVSTGFNGAIQELRLYNTVLSQDMIKLCYQTQKKNAGIVILK